MHFRKEVDHCQTSWILGVKGPEAEREGQPGQLQGDWALGADGLGLQARGYHLSDYASCLSFCKRGSDFPSSQAAMRLK